MDKNTQNTPKNQQNQKYTPNLGYIKINLNFYTLLNCYKNIRYWSQLYASLSSITSIYVS